MYWYIFCFLYLLSSIPISANIMKNVNLHTSMTNYPNISFYANTSIIIDPKDSNIIKKLGFFKKRSECATACVSYNNTHTSKFSGWESCKSFSYYYKTGQCLGNVDAQWKPYQESGIDSGRVHWPPAHCSSANDCSLNGKCINKQCICIPAWTGDRCQTLNVLPVERDSGLQTIQDGHNISSWGGSVLRGDDGKYHMWAAQMINHCGIQSCGRNSHIVHAVSDMPGGRYTVTDVVFPIFSHCPNVVRAPTGEYVMYFLANWNPHSPCQCIDGNTREHCEKNVSDSNWPPPGKGGSSWMSWSSNPEGPWSEPVVIFTPGQWHEQWPQGTNLAMLILNNGSGIGMIRMSESIEGSTPHLVTCKNWREPSTYTAHVSDLLFPPEYIDPDGVEDMTLYFDEDKNYHALFHQQTEKGDKRLVGSHAFSSANDGIDWKYSGTAYSNMVMFTDGSTLALGRRERPHVVMGDPLRPNKLTHFTNGAEYGNSTWNVPTGLDGCYTLVQSVAV